MDEVAREIPVAGGSDHDVIAVSALADPTRREIYSYVAGAHAAVSRDQVAEAIGVATHVARFHLDKLEEAGLLDVHFTRPPGRSGPGAGRPAKMYRPADAEFSVTVPERRYDMPGLIMTRAIAQTIATQTPIEITLRCASRDAGHSIGRALRPVKSKMRSQPSRLQAVLDVLVSCGFEPRHIEGRYVLLNCPFKALAVEEPDVVCGMNLAMIEALLLELEAENLAAVLDPGADRCCVVVR